MNNLTPLQQTIWNLAMYGGSVMYYFDEIVKIDAKNIEYVLNQSEIKGMVKPILHSLSKLTETDDDCFCELNYQLCDILNTSSCDYFLESLIKGKYYALDYNKSIEVNEFLKSKGFNIENLPSDQFIEKSTLKL